MAGWKGCCKVHVSLQSSKNFNAEREREAQRTQSILNDKPSTNIEF